MVEVAVNSYVTILECALPFSIIYGLGSVIVNMILNAAFGGRMCIGKNS